VETIYTIIALIIFGLLSWLIHFLQNISPLTDSEMNELAAGRRFNDLVTHYGFQDFIIDADKDFKKGLNTSGKFYRINEQLNSFPSLAASLLKGKKHEWRIIGFASKTEVLGLWANKGDNNNSVSLNISVNEIIKFAKEYGADTLLDFHNHTNAVFQASETDINSAIHLGTTFLDSRLNYFAFVVARGKFKQYAWWLLDSFLPINKYLVVIKQNNGKGIFINYDLNMELRRRRHFKNSQMILSASSNNIFSENSS
jgi:hypothetical protein